MIEFKYQNEPMLDAVKVVKNLRLDRLKRNPNTIILTKDSNTVTPNDKTLLRGQCYSAINRGIASCSR